MTEKKEHRPKLLSTTEVASILGVADAVVRELVHAGELRRFRLVDNGRFRFDLKDVDDFIEERKRKEMV